MHFSKSIIYAATFAGLAVAAPRDPSDLFKRAIIQPDCQGEQGEAISQAKAKCIEIANQASQYILTDKRYAVAYFNTDDEATLQRVSENYKKIASACDDSKIPIYCNDASASCGGSTLAVATTWSNDAYVPEIRFCPNSWSMGLPAVPTACGRDDLTSVLIHEMSHAVLKTDDLKSYKSGGGNCANDAYSYGYYARAIALKCLDRQGEGQTGIVNESYEGMATGAVTSGDIPVSAPTGGDSGENNAPPATEQPPAQPAPEYTQPPPVSNNGGNSGSGSPPVVYYPENGSSFVKNGVRYIVKTVSQADQADSSSGSSNYNNNNNNSGNQGQSDKDCDDAKKIKKSKRSANPLATFDRNGFEVDDYDYKRAKRSPAPGAAVDKNGFEVDDYDY